MQAYFLSCKSYSYSRALRSFSTPSGSNSRRPQSMFVQSSQRSRNHNHRYDFIIILGFFKNIKCYFQANIGWERQLRRRRTGEIHDQLVELILDQKLALSSLNLCSASVRAHDAATEQCGAGAGGRRLHLCSRFVAQYAQRRSIFISQAQTLRQTLNKGWPPSYPGIIAWAFCLSSVRSWLII